MFLNWIHTYLNCLLFFLPSNSPVEIFCWKIHKNWGLCLIYSNFKMIWTLIKLHDSKLDFQTLFRSCFVTFLRCHFIQTNRPVSPFKLMSLQTFKVIVYKYCSKLKVCKYRKQDTKFSHNPKNQWLFFLHFLP